MLCAMYGEGIEELKSTKDNSLFLRFKDDRLKWANNVPVLYVRDEYLRLYYHITTHTNQPDFTVLGTPGIGKTLFGLWLVYRLLKDSRELSRPVSILYIDISGKASHVVVNNNTLNSYQCAPNPFYPTTDYLIIDTFGQAFAAECNAKRIYISSLHNNNVESAKAQWDLKVNSVGAVHMDPFTLNEARLFSNPIIGESLQALILMFDIFGGTMRLIRRSLAHDDNVAFDDSNWVNNFLFETMKDFFDFDAKSSSIYKKACRTLTDLFDVEDSTEQLKLVRSSAFRHCGQRGNKYYASTFMHFLCGAIEARRDDIRTRMLTLIVGSHGMGSLHEYYAHRQIFANLRKGCYYAPQNLLTQSHCLLRVHIKRKKLIRSIRDIYELEDGEYGLPTVTNFPVVDAIIKPDILLQMTISDSHETRSSDKLFDILKVMGIKTGKMIFVLCALNVEKFKYANTMEVVAQYKMLPDLTSINGKFTEKQLKSFVLTGKLTANELITIEKALTKKNKKRKQGEK